MNRRNLWLASLIPLLLAAQAGSQPSPSELGPCLLLQGASAPFDIQTGSYFPDDWMARPSVAMLSGGGFVASWVRWYDRHQPMSAHGSKVFTKTGEVINHVWPTDGSGPTLLAAHPGGGFTIAGNAYSVQSYTYMGNIAQRFDSRGRPLTKPYPLAGGPIAIAPGKAGRLLALTTFFSGAEPTVSLLRYGRWGQPLGSPLLVTTAWSGAALASDGHARGIVAWIEGSRLFIRRASADGRWLGGAFPADPDLERLPARVSVAAAPDGRFVVVWEGTGDGSGKGIFARRFAANGQPQGPVFQVNSQTEGDQTSGRVAVQGDGRFLVVWQSPYSRVSRIHGQYYAADGSLLGSEMLVAGDDPYRSEVEPAVATDAAGHYLVAWRRFEDPDAISGRLFTAP